MAREYQPHEESGIHPDPGDFALALHEHLADGLSDQADDYLAEVVQEIFAISPAVRRAVFGEDE